MSSGESALEMTWKLFDDGTSYISMTVCEIFDPDFQLID